MGQPLEDCWLCDWAADTVNEARQVAQYFAGAFEDDGVSTRNLIHELWGLAYKRCPRHTGIVEPGEFQYFFVREVFRWTSEHITPGDEKTHHG